MHKTVKRKHILCCNLNFSWCGIDFRIISIVHAHLYVFYIWILGISRCVHLISRDIFKSTGQNKEGERREREREREIGDVIEEKRTYRIESFHESVKGNLLTFFTT